MYARHDDIPWDENGPTTAALESAPADLPDEMSESRHEKLPRILLNGVMLHAITERHCIEHIMSALAAGRGGVVVTPNVDHLRRCPQDLSFSAVVHEADLVVADGMPVVWASRLQGTPIPERVAGSDLISSLSAAAAGQGRSVFLLGGDPGTAEGAAAILRDRFPQLKIAGVHCPPVGFDASTAELDRVAALLKEAKPDIVFVALGSPKQERFMDRLRGQLPQTWWLGVGVSFSFLCGQVQRAPQWMRQFGLEWVHRLGQEPRRLFKRYIMMGLPFAGWMLLRAASRGIPNRLLPHRLEKMQEDITQLEARLRRQMTVQPQEVQRMESDENPQANATMDTLTIPTHARLGTTSADNQLRSLILLAGSVRPTQLAATIQRSILDLPTGKGGTVLTNWLEQADGVAQMLGMDRLAVRVMVDASAPEPRSGATDQYRVERDRSEYRGTGGLLAHLAGQYDEDDLILVANAAQFLLDPLPALFTALRKTGGMVGVVGHRDGTPSGMMLLTCRSLRLIPKVGFVDMKEQGLPAIAAKHDVRVLQCRRPTGLPIRTLSDYVEALRAIHGPHGRPMPGDPLSDPLGDPLSEEWKSTFAIVEPGASVAPSARIHDSIILSGATVDAGAVVVRSVIGPGGIVRKDRKAVDQCVAGEMVKV